MKKTIMAAFICVAFSLPCFTPDLAHAAQGDIRPQDFPDASSNFSFTLENDLFSNTDRHYTNGVRLSYMPAQASLPQWMDNSIGALPIFDPKGQKRIGFSLGQSMFTPKDIRAITPDPADRPYAGWLYANMSLISDTGKQYDQLDLTGGVVGPYSLAADTQKFVHSVIGADQPKGWHAQLKNEPGFIASYEHRWRGLYEFSPFGFGADITPHVGATLGNVYTYGEVGGILRIGRDLPSDYGPPLIRPTSGGSDFFIPTQNFGYYFFTGIEGRAVGRNIFLDGNTFANSASVQKNNFVGDLQLGFAMTFNDVRVAYTHVFRTEEFVGQHGGDTFGAFTVSMRF